MNGEIYINHDVLVHGPDGERSSNDAQILLRHVIQHEIIHATSTSNYRKKVTTTKKKILGKNETSSTYPNYRRIGFQMNKRLKN